MSVEYQLLMDCRSEGERGGERGEREGGGGGGEEGEILGST